MFVGHYGLALAAKRVAPRTSMGSLFLAVQMLDILWAPAILLGIEHAHIVHGLLPASSLLFTYYPWTHGLLMAFGWGWLVFRFSKNLVLGALVFSHWLLDFLVHTPDLPIYRGGALLGLGLWRFREATLLTETLFLLLGLWIYLRTTRAVAPAGAYAMKVFVALLIAMEVANLYGPVPNSINALAIAAEVSYLGFAAIAWWLDRLREPIDHTEEPIRLSLVDENE
jgi:hypothetical protein